MRSAPVGTNGPGEPRYKVTDIEPGSIVRFGTDDDVTALVIANYPSTIRTGAGPKAMQHLVYYGCLNEAGTWGEAALFQQDHGLTDTVTVVMAP